MWGEQSGPAVFEMMKVKYQDAKSGSKRCRWVHTNTWAWTDTAEVLQSETFWCDHCFVEPHDISNHGSGGFWDSRSLPIVLLFPKRYSLQSFYKVFLLKLAAWGRLNLFTSSSNSALRCWLGDLCSVWLHLKPSTNRITQFQWFCLICTLVTLTHIRTYTLLPPITHPWGGVDRDKTALQPADWSDWLIIRSDRLPKLD